MVICFLSLVDWLCHPRQLKTTCYFLALVGRVMCTTPACYCGLELLMVGKCWLQSTWKRFLMFVLSLLLPSFFLYVLSLLFLLADSGYEFHFSRDLWRNSRLRLRLAFVLDYGNFWPCSGLWYHLVDPSFHISQMGRPSPGILVRSRV